MSINDYELMVKFVQVKLFVLLCHLFEEINLFAATIPLKMEAVYLNVHLAFVLWFFMQNFCMYCRVESMSRVLSLVQ